MKKLFPFILTGTILASSCMICYGGTATLSKENKETSFDIYATYEPGENDYFSAPVKKDGTCEIELPNGIRISVQDVTQENLTLIVYLIPVQDEDAWEWFTACLSGRGTRLLPFEIYFEDRNGTRIPADKIPVQITLPEAYETIAVFALDDMPATEETPEITLPDSFTHPAAFSLDTDGTAEELILQSTEKTFTFQTDGSPYYILAEKDTTDPPTPSPTPTKEPTSTPTPTPTEEPTSTPTPTPTKEPTREPTNTPTETPTKTPTKTPSLTPSPTKVPSLSPTLSPTKIPDSQTGKDNPSTGDQTSPGKWIFGVIASGIGLAAVYRKKKEDKQEL